MISRCCDEIAYHAHDGQPHFRGKPYHYRHRLAWGPLRLVRACAPRVR